MIIFALYAMIIATGAIILGMKDVIPMTYALIIALVGMSFVLIALVIAWLFGKE